MLCVNGVNAAKESAVIHKQYAELPLTELMKSLGMGVEWLNDNTAKITCPDCANKEYTLSLSGVSLEAAGQSGNLLLPPPGGSRVYRVLDKELMLNDETVSSVFFLMGKNWYKN